MAVATELARIVKAMTARHEGELTEALKAVPWAPAGLATSDHSPKGRASALLGWADGHPGIEADAIIASLRPLLLKQRDEVHATRMDS